MLVKMPEAGASISTVALSVSTSMSGSPLVTGWPSALSQLSSVPFSCATPSAGMITSVAILKPLLVFVTRVRNIFHFHGQSMAGNWSIGGIVLVTALSQHSMTPRLHHSVFSFADRIARKKAHSADAMTT